MSQADLMSAIRDKSRLIDEKQEKFDTKEYTTHEQALALQRLRMDRHALQGLLKYSLVPQEVLDS